ncbi:MAG: hypothetical protein NZM09_05880 [Ignavibacterium sp.]|nr:hypothetical protein [Ignavibacterium sp.]MCX7612414.1 hypothetical protein [Ignavibacterium sp.]MDW8375208.1 hypothetical protein [Ignavibacteriales bacterium]
MEIRGIINKVALPDDKSQNKLSSKKETQRGDVVEISKEAKDLIQKVKEQQIQQIRERIQNNYYNSDEVIYKVAEKILREIRS